MASAPPLKDDWLEGAKAIAQFLGWPVRRVYHVADTGGLPIWREPGVGLVARKSRLTAHFENREQKAVDRLGKIA